MADTADAPRDPVVVPTPDYVMKRIARGRERMFEGAPVRNECMEFWRGNQYVFRNTAGTIINQSTLIDSEKPRHRFRQTRNALRDAVEHEVSRTTKRVPSYEVDPTSGDPAVVSAARIAEKVALYGYDQWDIRSVTERVVTLAVVADEGFAWPYFDNQIGPPIGEDEDGTLMCEGDVRIKVLHANQVMWEPGIKFDDSRWHAVQDARTPDEVKALPGYMGPGKLLPDSISSPYGSLSSEKRGAELVMVTEYLERPCPKYPNGRRLVMAKGRLLVPEEPYPLLDHDGRVIDEPVMVKLSRIIDPDSDRDLGLVRDCIDAQRTINDCTNKQLEWKNLALNPQLFLQNGVMKQRLTDEPGAVYTIFGNNPPQWRTVPPIPGELQGLKDEARAYIRQVFAQSDIPTGVEAAQAIALLIERDDSRGEAFTARLADFHSRLMRHCLYLVARYYTEGRLLKIRGMFGPWPIENFKGADLLGQTDVRVLPGSIAPFTKQQMAQTVMNYAQLGWVDPMRAMWAIENGTMEDLIDSYNLDIAAINRQIRQIAGLSTGAPGADVPMAQPYINPKVALYTLHNWMKTDDFQNRDPGAKEAATLLEEQYQQLDAQEQQKQMMQQQAQASQMGAENATRPAQSGALPSLPALPS